MKSLLSLFVLFILATLATTTASAQYKSPEPPEWVTPRRKSSSGPLPAPSLVKSEDPREKREEEKKFWEFKPKFTPEIEGAIEALLNCRKQHFLRKIETGRGLPMKNFAFDEKDLKSLSQRDKEKAMIHFMVVNQPRYDRLLRIEIRTALSNLKMEAQSKIAAQAIQRIQ